MIEIPERTDTIDHIYAGPPDDTATPEPRMEDRLEKIEKMVTEIHTTMIYIGRVVKQVGDQGPGGMMKMLSGMMRGK